jgi:hypothetical protein
MGGLYEQYLREQRQPKKQPSLYDQYLAEQQPDSPDAGGPSSPIGAEQRILAMPQLSPGQKLQHVQMIHGNRLRRVQAQEEEEAGQPLSFRETVAAGIPRDAASLGHMAASIVTAPIRSMTDAVVAPQIGERRPDPRLVAARFGTPVSQAAISRWQQTPTYDVQHGGITGQQRALGAAQALATIVAPELGAIPGGALAMTSYGLEDAKTPGELAGSAALGAGLGAAGELAHAAGPAFNKAIDPFDGALEDAFRGAKAQFRAEGRSFAADPRVQQNLKYDYRLKDLREAFSDSPHEPPLGDRTWWEANQPPLPVQESFERVQSQQAHALPRGAIQLSAPTKGAPLYAQYLKETESSTPSTPSDHISKFLNSPDVAAARARSDAHTTIAPDAPERETFRQETADRLYGDGAPVKGRRIDVLLGHPGSGKSAVFADNLVREHGSLLLDADLAKRAAPEYDEGYGANALHPESVEIRNRVMERAVENGDNIVFPTVGDPAMTLDVVRGMVEAGYDVHVTLADIPPTVAAERVMAGVHEGTRHFRDPQAILDKGSDPLAAYEALKQEPGVVHYARYDNNVPKGQSPILIEEGAGPGAFRPQSDGTRLDEGGTAGGAQRLGPPPGTPLKSSALPGVSEAPAPPSGGAPAARSGVDVGAELERLNTTTLHANPIGAAVRAGAQLGLKAVRWTRDLPPVAKLTDAFNVVFDPAARGPEAGATAGIVRAQAGEQAGAYEQAARAIRQASRAFDRAPEVERLDFMHRMETGRQQQTPALTAFAKTMRSSLDQMRDQIRALGTGALDEFIENYFPHIWEDPQAAQNIIGQYFGKRPLEGSKNFLKERSIPTIADGMAKGLKPVSTNPTELYLLKLREMQRFYMAQSVVRDMKAQGLLDLVPNGTRAKPGWVRLNDKVARVPGVGEYWAPEGAARIINNYLSPGLRGNAVYDLARGSSNALNQAQLGLSFFHLGFTTLDSMVSRTSLAIEQAGHGKPLQAARTLASVPVAPWTNARLGSRIKGAYLTPGSRGADIDILASWVRRAGGRVVQDSFYKNSAPEKLVAALRQGGAKGYGTAALNTIPAVLQTVAKPMMDFVVPAQKLGVFGDLAREAMGELHRKNPQATVAQENAVLQRVWDSVDNRMGQLVYDNLFWNKTFKDLSMASTRSVGWNQGTVRELGGGLGDIAREGTKFAAGESAELTHRAAYVIALPITVGMMGAVITYLATGKGPQELKDYFFPKTGSMDANGNGDRVQLPSYMKDMVAYTGDPWQTVKHKMAPGLAAIGEMLNNEDFYGDQIRNPHDPFVQQALQEAAYIGKTIAPFSITNARETAARGDRSLLGRYGPWVGITPAPRRIVRSAAQNRMAEYLAERRVTGATPEDAEARLARREILRDLRGNASNLESDLSKAIERGQLTPPQFAKMLKRAGTTPMQEQYRRLTLPQALDVFRAADERERGLFLDALNKKIANAGRGQLPRDSSP